MDEIKDKIILAVKEAIANNAEAVDCDYDIIEIDCDDVDHIAEQVADTLIAAGIGDVEEAEHRAEVYERALYHTAISDTEYQEAIEQAEKELAEGKKE